MRVMKHSLARREKGGESRADSHSTRYLASLLRLPVELEADLANAWVACASDDSEVRAVDVARRVIKLSMVENIEEFEAQIKCHLLSNHRMLQKSEVSVIESGAMEEAAIRRAER